MILKLWPGILIHFKEEIYNQETQQGAKANNEEEKKKCDLTETNCKITKLFQEQYELPLPDWWLDKYPSKEISLRDKRLKKLMEK